jgi:hypothetical protein
MPIIKDISSHTQKNHRRVASCHENNLELTNCVPANDKQFYNELPYLQGNHDRLMCTDLQNYQKENKPKIDVPNNSQKGKRNRVISMFRMRVKKNQMFLFQQKSGESKPIDSFMFSFYHSNGAKDKSINKSHQPGYPNNNSSTFEEKPSSQLATEINSESFDYPYKRPTQFSAGFRPASQFSQNMSQSKRPMTKGEIKKIFTPLKKTRRPCTRPLNL